MSKRYYKVLTIFAGVCLVWDFYRLATGGFDNTHHGVLSFLLDYLILTFCQDGLKEGQ